MPEEDLIIHVLNGNIFTDCKAKFNRDNGLAEARIRRGIIAREIVRFEIDSKHIILSKKPTFRRNMVVSQHVFVDGKTNKSIGFVSDPYNDDLPPEIRKEKLTNLTRIAYLKSIAAPKKLDKYLTIIILFAGYGIIRFVEWILTSIFAVI